MKVSILILTYNEEKNLPHCLAALGWCDDIVVLDSGSHDETVSIAKAYGARVLTRKFDDFAGQRNFGLETADFRHQWVLHLDADEIVTDEFVQRLADHAPLEDVFAWNVPSKTMLFGRWIKHAGMYPTYQVRLGHRDKLRFKQVGHGQRENLAAENVGVFDEPYLHYSFSHGLLAWLQKHLRYAKDEAAFVIEARNARYATMESSTAVEKRRAAKIKAAKVPSALRPLLRFGYVYFWKQGFRDGRAGFIYAFMLSVYEGMIGILVLERMMKGNAIPKTKNRTDKSSNA